MSPIMRKTLGLLAVLNVLALLMTACHTAHPPRPCDSSEMILPEDIMAAGESISSEEASRRFGERFAQRSEWLSWLSLRLDVAQSEFEYGADIPFRVTITNGTDHPVVFFRPQVNSLGADLYPIGMFEIELVSATGEAVRAAPLMALPRRFPLPELTREAFSLLPPGESCYMDCLLARDRVWLPLPEHIPPGNYQMTIVLSGWAIGPSPTWEQTVDVGAWVGTTEPSNAVSFTILP